MMILLAAVIVSGAVVFAALRIVGEMRAARDASSGGDRMATLLAMFAPALAAAQEDPRAILVWQPIASAARHLFPSEFVEIDRASGGSFPFTQERIDAAHAQWTADWLAWEHAHDVEFKLKAAVAESGLAQAATTVARAQVDAVQREKLEVYQRRYAEYVRTAKALQALMTP
jgi:hypothetical protein